MVGKHRQVPARHRNTRDQPRGIGQDPALIRRARVPGETAPWIQPTDSFDAYKLVNPFTGQPDTCTYSGKTLKVTLADGAGNNVWVPGQYGWGDVV